MVVLEDGVSTDFLFFSRFILIIPLHLYFDKAGLWLLSSLTMMRVIRMFYRFMSIITPSLGSTEDMEGTVHLEITILVEMEHTV